MALKDIVKVSCTNFKVYVGDKMVYSPFNGVLAPFWDKRVLWIDSAGDILLIGIEGSDEDEEK
jgi:hypothetical protein